MVAMKPLFAAALFAAVLIGGFFVGAIRTITDDAEVSW